MKQKLFSEEDKKLIVESIRIAEKNCSGEIRVHIDDECEIDPLDRAVEIFEILGMHKTKLRNGVLFYMSEKDKKFAVIGDVGINSKVGYEFWHEIRDIVLDGFRNKEFGQGLANGIKKVGQALAAYFPYDSKTDVNELSDEISFYSKKE